MIKKLCFCLIFLSLTGFLVFCAPAPAEYEKEVHFFCDYLGTFQEWQSGQNHPNQSFDRMFSYRQFSDGHTQVQFYAYDKWKAVKLKQETLYRSDVDSTTETRTSFEIQRFNLNTSVLIRSHVYHLHPEEYKKDMEERKHNPYFISYSDKPLPFSDDPVPKDFVKVGFDKSHWQCHKVAGLKYLLKKWGVTLMQILSAG